MIDGGFAAVPKWLALDGQVPVGAKVVYMVLAAHAAQTGWYMTHRQIAGEAGISVSSVQRHLAWLREAGLVWWSERRTTEGDRDANLYRIAVSQPEVGSGHHDRTVRAQRPDPSVMVTEQKVDVVVDEEVDTALAHRERRATPALPFFEAFWQNYPRKVGKRAAETAFVRAAGRAGSHLPLIEGAVRLAADPNLPEPRFIPHPTTWLNRDGWLDAPLPNLCDAQPRTAQSVTEQNMALAQALVQRPALSSERTEP